MLISASRRTDIPNFYSEWFYNRIKDGYVLVRNPMSIHQISKINLSPEVVDGIVFWTKNPAPMMDRLKKLKDYTFYFQFTITSYDKDVEPGVPSKNKKVIPTFQRLSDMIGPDRVVWRYDPIFISEKYSIDYHIEYFAKMAQKLKDHTTKCTFSFIDLYRNTARNIKNLELLDFPIADKLRIAQAFAEIALGCGLKIDTCAEDIDLQQYNISHARCIDDRLFEQLLGCSLSVEKDKNQRLECGCVSSIDIGMYNTCQNLCRYCYANYSSSIVRKNVIRHNPVSPLISGDIDENDTVKERQVLSCKNCQVQLFD